MQASTVTGIVIVTLAFSAIVSEACFGCPADPTCKAPCYVCGVCFKKCCQNLFRGYGPDQERFIIPCLDPGRSADQIQPELARSEIDGQVIEEVEKQSFVICDEDGDHGLTWEEVSNCIVKTKRNELIL